MLNDGSIIINMLNKYSSVEESKIKNIEISVDKDDKDKCKDQNKEQDKISNMINPESVDLLKKKRYLFNTSIVENKSIIISSKLKQSNKNNDQFYDKDKDKDWDNNYNKNNNRNKKNLNISSSNISNNNKKPIFKIEKKQHTNNMIKVLNCRKLVDLKKSILLKKQAQLIQKNKDSDLSSNLLKYILNIKPENCFLRIYYNDSICSIDITSNMGDITISDLEKFYNTKINKIFQLHYNIFNLNCNKSSDFTEENIIIDNKIDYGRCNKNIIPIFQNNLIEYSKSNYNRYYAYNQLEITKKMNDINDSITINIANNTNTNNLYNQCNCGVKPKQSHNNIENTNINMNSNSIDKEVSPGFFYNLINSNQENYYIYGQNTYNAFYNLFNQTSSSITMMLKSNFHYSMITSNNMCFYYENKYDDKILKFIINKILNYTTTTKNSNSVKDLSGILGIMMNNKNEEIINYEENKFLLNSLIEYVYYNIYTSHLALFFSNQNQTNKNYIKGDVSDSNSNLYDNSNFDSSCNDYIFFRDKFDEINKTQYQIIDDAFDTKHESLIFFFEMLITSFTNAHSYNRILFNKFYKDLLSTKLSNDIADNINNAAFEGTNKIDIKNIPNETHSNNKSNLELSILNYLKDYRSNIKISNKTENNTSLELLPNSSSNDNKNVKKENDRFFTLFQELSTTVVIRALTQFESIIDLKNENINDNNLSIILKALKPNTNLVSLDLSNNNINLLSSFEIGSLLQIQHNSILELNLNNTGLDCFSLRNICFGLINKDNYFKEFEIKLNRLNLANNSKLVNCENDKNKTIREKGSLKNEKISKDKITNDNRLLLFSISHICFLLHHLKNIRFLNLSSINFIKGFDSVLNVIFGIEYDTVVNFNDSIITKDKSDKSIDSINCINSNSIKTYNSYIHLKKLYINNIQINQKDAIKLSQLINYTYKPLNSKSRISKQESAKIQELENENIYKADCTLEVENINKVKIQTLSLNNNYLNYPSFYKSFKYGNHCIQELYLNNCGLTNIITEDLVILIINSKSLRVLDLSSNSINDKNCLNEILLSTSEFKVIREIKNNINKNITNLSVKCDELINKNIVSLDLSNNNCFDLFNSNIYEILGLSYVESIDISKNHDTNLLINKLKIDGMLSKEYNNLVLNKCLKYPEISEQIIIIKEHYTNNVILRLKKLQSERQRKGYLINL